MVKYAEADLSLSIFPIMESTIIIVNNHCNMRPSIFFCILNEPSPPPHPTPPHMDLIEREVGRSVFAVPLVGSWHSHLSAPSIDNPEKRFGINLPLRASTSHLMSSSVRVLFALMASPNARAPSLENPLYDKFNFLRVQFVWKEATAWTALAMRAMIRIIPTAQHVERYSNAFHHSNRW